MSEKIVHSATLQTRSDANSIGSMLRHIAEGNETSFEVVEMAEGGQELKVSRRQLQPEPPELAPLARSPVANHTFHTIDTFQAYLQEFGGENTVVVADCSSLIATASLDERQEEGGIVLVQYQPAFHPVFDRWRRYFETPRKVLDFAHFALENRRQIVRPDGKELSLLMSQLKMSKSIEMAEGRGPKAINGVMVTIEISGVKKEMPTPLPDSVSIQTPIFLEGPSVEVDFDLLVFERNGEIMVTGTNPDATAAVADSFIENIREMQLAKGLVTFGASAYASQKTLQ